jgi:hypothetical protein
MCYTRVMASKSRQIHLHELSLELAENPGKAERFMHFVDLTLFGLRSASGQTRRTPLRCRLRPGRVPCETLLMVRRRDLPPAIEWSCPGCGGSGEVIGWQGLPGSDLLSRCPTETDTDSELLRIRISAETHLALRELGEQEESYLPWIYGVEVDEDETIWLCLQVHQLAPVAATLLRIATAVPDEEDSRLLFELGTELGELATSHPSSQDALATIEAEQLARAVAERIEEAEEQRFLQELEDNDP